MPQPPGSFVYARLPLSFEPNSGQIDPDIKVFVRGANNGFYLTNNEAVMELARAGRCD